MLFRAPLLAVAAALLAHQVSANGNGGRPVTCDPGHYHDSFLNCRECPDGHFFPNRRSSNVPTSCNPCSAGKGCNSSRTTCNDCGPGEFSTGGSGCRQCPAGQTNTSDHRGCQNCPAGTYSISGGSCQRCPDGQTSTSDHKSCQKCPAGTYSSAGGSCTPCAPGTFNNVAGAKSCCSCCAGWYSDSFGSRSCRQCPSDKKFSAVGSNNGNDCKQNQGSGRNKLPNYTTSCSMVADNVCPNPTGNGPQGTAISQIKRRDVQCAKGFEACPRYSGNGGSDCVDTENDPESCGGCLGLDGEGPGTDCTAIKGVSVTRCVKRSCVIDSCRKGWVKSLDGTSCVLNSHSTGSSDDLHVQDTDAKKRRSSAKRAIRGNRDTF